MHHPYTEAVATLAPDDTSWCHLADINPQQYQPHPVQREHGETFCCLFPPHHRIHRFTTRTAFDAWMGKTHGVTTWP